MKSTSGAASAARAASRSRSPRSPWRRAARSGRSASMPPVESMWTPSGSTSPAATYSMTEVEQPHSGWMRKSAPGCSARIVGDVARADPGVDVALAVPHVHRLAGALLDEGAEEHVGPEEDLGVLAVLAVDVLDDRDGVGGRHAVVGLRLDLGRGVDVHHDDRAGVLGLPRPQLRRGDRVGQRAAGVGIGQQDGLLRAQDRGRLGHEVHAAERDHVGVGGRRLLREAERVADVVGDLLDLGQLVVVGEDDRAALGGERADLVLQGGDVVQ